jgi:hypothetical protein
VFLERGVCSSVRADLASRGHKIMNGGDYGGYQGIAIHYTPSIRTFIKTMFFEKITYRFLSFFFFQFVLKGGIVYHGASEFRKDGQAAGY